MSELLAKKSCGVCIGSPHGEVCNTEPARWTELPPAPAAQQLCLRALFLLSENRPGRLERNGIPHVGLLIDTAIKASEAPLYSAATKELLGDAFEIADNIARRPFASAENQIQAQTFLAFEPMYFDKYCNGGLTTESIGETRSRLGRVIEETVARRYRDFDYTQQGIVNGHLSQTEIMSLLLRWNIEVWPATHREEKSDEARLNHDCNVVFGNEIATQIKTENDRRYYDSSVLVIDYQELQRAVMSSCERKKSDYPKFIREQIIREARGEQLSPAKTRMLDKASHYLQERVSNFAEAA